MRWFCERVDGLCSVGNGLHGWEQLGLNHDDVTKPNRVRQLGFMDDAGRQTLLQLTAAEVLHLAVRHTLTLGAGQALPVRPPLLLLGIVREDGSGVYALVQPDGNVLLSSNRDGAHGR